MIIDFFPVVVFAASTNDKFSFDADQTYEYQYESNVKTSMGGASEEHSSLHLRTTAQFEVISKCEMVLRVSFSSQFNKRF